MFTLSVCIAFKGKNVQRTNLDDHANMVLNIAWSATLRLSSSSSHVDVYKYSSGLHASTIENQQYVLVVRDCHLNHLHPSHHLDHHTLHYRDCLLGLIVFKLSW